MSKTKFVLDASVALAWAFREERNAYTQGVLHTLKRGEAIVPAIWPLEMGIGISIWPCVWGYP